MRNGIFENPLHPPRGKYDVIVSMETGGGDFVHDVTTCSSVLAQGSRGRRPRNCIWCASVIRRHYPFKFTTFTWSHRRASVRLFMKFFGLAHPKRLLTLFERAFYDRKFFDSHMKLLFVYRERSLFAYLDRKFHYQKVQKDLCTFDKALRIKIRSILAYFLSICFLRLTFTYNSFM